MTEPRHLQLTDRLRGIYHLPVNDGAGPLDGSFTFTRQFTGQPEVQFEAADVIDSLERGDDVAVERIDSLISRLLVEDFYMNMPNKYVPPIHKEAVERLQQLRQGE
jgi:hypothetical protein